MTDREPSRHILDVAGTSCESRGGFQQALETDFFSSEDRIIFRGQAFTEWPLASEWERFCLAMEEDGQLTQMIADMGWSQMLEIQLEPLEAFKALAGGRPELPTSDHDLSEDEWWLWGRHFGLHGRMLDWTESPRIAAYPTLFMNPTGCPCGRLYWCVI